jgi:amidase
MNRRNFLKKSSIVPFIIPPLVAISCKKTTDGSTTASTVTPDQFPLEESTLQGLQELMSTGKYTARQLTEFYLKRIDQLDKKGPMLNSVIELNSDALTIADKLDEERKNGMIRSALHGVPVLIKDNIDTADKLQTTAGALAMEGNIAVRDAFIVSKLRDAGAIIIGKTNLSEWANFRSERSSSGWSSRGGQTKNPYVLDRNPCGSSSGSGTAVAANLCAVAIGTETNGSIGCPSSINGIVGIKPTVGLWSRAGIIPISKTQDTAGPMTRSVTDAAIVLGLLAGKDERDEATTRSSRGPENDYTKFLLTDGLKGKRIGIEKSYLHVHEAVDALFQKAINTMKSQGAEIVEVDFMSQLKDTNSEEYLVLQYEFKDGLNKYLESANGKMKSLKDVINFNIQNESKAMPFFKQEILVKSEALGSLQDIAYVNAVKKITTIAKNSIDKTLSSFKLDAICGPTNGPTWCTDLINGDFFTGYGMYSPAAIAGYPHINVPMGFVNELPLGLTFLSTAFSEPSLISIGYAYEQASKNRKAPRFLESISKNA